MWMYDKKLEYPIKIKNTNPIFITVLYIPLCKEKNV